MIITMYFSWERDIGALMALHSQCDPSLYNYENVEFTFAKSVIPDKKLNKCTLLAKVDIDSSEIVEILDIQESFFVSHSAKHKLYKENSKLFIKNDPAFVVKEAAYDKPDSLFVTDINWSLATTALDLKKYPLFIGPKGCGKTEFAYSLAQATNRKLLAINCGTLFKPKASLIGTIQAKEGSTYLVNSEFLNSFISTEPTLIFLDELSRIPPMAANYMMTILDRKQSYLYLEDEGRILYKGADVVFCAAANFGFEYTDTRNQDGAFLDRFIKIMIDYLSEEEEVNMICQKAAGVNRADVVSLVKKANQCRRQVENLRVAVSSRQLLDMADFLRSGFSLHEVIEHLFINLFINGSSDMRKEVEQIVNATI